MANTKEKQNDSSSTVNKADKQFDLGKKPISSIMTTSVVTISNTATIKTAIQLITNQKISGMPVVNESGFLIGVVTEKDLLLSYASTDLDSAIQYTKSPDYTSPEATLKDALMKLLKQNRRWLPVVDNKKKPVGVIARRDLLQVFLSQENK